MPIVDVLIVSADPQGAANGLARTLADGLGRVFGSAPGRTWVRLQTLAEAAYAENEAQSAATELPVFVTVLHARPPVGVALVEELRAVTAAVADGLGRPTERVHVQYAPAGAGRQAFGGRLVD